MKSNKLDGLDFKNVIIGILIVTIIFGGLYFLKYQKNVNRVINYNIHTNLYETKDLLDELYNELINYENEKMDKEEFQTLIKNNSLNIGFNIYTTKKYKYISKRLEYVDIKILDYYIEKLARGQISDEEELEFHKNNILEICKSWREINIELSDNYFLPSTELKETLIKTKNLSKRGNNQFYKDE